MILIKLGGSIITNKEKPLSPRKKTIDNILKEIGKIKEPVIIVHGGGSYGHYWSVKYDMHTKPAKTTPKGVAIVKNSMVELNKIILDSAVKNKVNSYCLPPTDFMKGNKSMPQCGFSSKVAGVLNYIGVDYEDINVLADEVVRQGIKDFSDWPTIPQLYVKGEFVGGCDIITEMALSGELDNLFEKNGIEFDKDAAEKIREANA